MAKKETSGSDHDAAQTNDKAASRSAARARAKEASKNRKASAGTEGRVVQHKPTIGEALGGKADGLARIGEGSAVETAPRIMGAVVQATKNDREVKQGDDVILHTRSLLNGKLENAGAMLKANQDGTIAVRVPLQSGGYKDFSPVYNGPQNGEDWFSIPEESGALDDARAAEEDEIAVEDAATAQLAEEMEARNGDDTVDGSKTAA